MRQSNVGRIGALLGSLALVLSLLVLPSMSLSACASAQRNPDGRPGLRKRAEESRRDMDRRIENKRRRDRDN
jgi:hypothetical protein